MIDIIFHDKTGVTPYNPGQTGGFENAAGSGEIHYYRLFDGVGIMLLRLEMETYTEIRTHKSVCWRLISASMAVLKPAFPCVIAFC